MNKALRFAGLIRVSTEQQAEEGESLRTQKASIEKDAAQLGGTIVAWYGGQEHATPGYEKSEVDRLVRDAAKDRRAFDAVMVANADRWSRDNTKSQAGLDVFKLNRVRFFVGVSEYDLYNPEHVLFLGMSAVIGRFQAQHQNRKSMLNRIERAKRGLPTCGKLPFGRTFDRKAERWGIDPKQQALVADCAKRYLAGERLPDLAEEYGLNHSNLHKVLMHRCGTDWEIVFESDELNIHETVKIAVPRLLDERTIAAVRRKALANKTFEHKQPKYQYLLGGMVFCAHCGYAMFGQTNHGKRSYYRHAHTYRVRGCTQPKTWVLAEDLEENVIRHLFETFGNPLAVQRAIDEATPNRDKIAEYQERQKRLEDALAKVKVGRDRILRLVTKGTITDTDAEDELSALAKREQGHHEELSRLEECLANVPTKELMHAVAGRVSAKFTALRHHANASLDDMTWDDRRLLCQTVFGGNLPDGRRMGVYISWDEDKQWRYTIRGHLIDELDQLPFPVADVDSAFTFGTPRKQRELVAVTGFAYP